MPEFLLALRFITQLDVSAPTSAANRGSANFCRVAPRPTGSFSLTAGRCLRRTLIHLNYAILAPIGHRMRPQRRHSTVTTC